MMKFALFPLFTLLFVSSGCIQVNIPQTESRETVQYSLELPSGFQPPKTVVVIREFLSESPAKFKMLSRKGSTVQVDSFAKWSQTPSVMVSSAFRRLYDCNSTDYRNAKYILTGDILTFERNLDTNTADFSVQYTLMDSLDKEVIFKEKISSSIALAGDSSADFAAAMSKAVAEQAEKLKQRIENVKTAK